MIQLYFHPEDGVPLGTQRDFTGVIEQRLAEIDSAELHFSSGMYHFFPHNAIKTTLYISNTDSQKFPTKRCGIFLEHKQAIRFVGTGDVLFVFHGALVALCGLDCGHISWEHINLDYHCPSVIDLTVLSVSEDLKTIEVHVPDVYSYERFADGVLFFGDPCPVSGAPLFSLDTRKDLGCQHFTKQDGVVRRVRSPFAHSTAQIDPTGGLFFTLPDKWDAQVSDVFQLRDTKRDAAGIFFERCQTLEFRNSQIGFLYAFGVMAQCCGSVLFSNMLFQTIQSDRMSASAADMIQCVNCSGHVFITDCVFVNPHDDPINLHGVFLELESVRETVYSLAFRHPQTLGYACVFAGDLLQFYDRETLQPTGSPTRVLAVTGPTPDDLTHIFVTLEAPPELAPDVIYAIEDLTRVPTVCIKDNLFQQIPTRGLLLTTGRRAVVSGNQFERIHMPAIYISADAKNWYESGPVRDLLIEKNQFRHCAQEIVFDPTVSEAFRDHVHSGVVLRDHFSS